MAFTTRSTRDTLAIPKDLLETPGPGTFTTTSSFSKRPHFALAPFSSTSKRSINQIAKTEAPGPGQYFREERNNTVQIEPSSIFKSRTGRFHHPTSDSPSPGDYYKPITWVQPKRGSTAKKNDNSILWVKVSTAPSIPDREQSHGYEEGSSGELIRQRPPVKGHSGTKDDTVGPGEYNNPGTPPNPWEKVKGQGVFKSKTKRGIFDVKNDVPAPGQYFNSEKKNEDIFFEEPISNSSSFASKTKRTDWNSRTDPSIGPGSYIDPYKHASSFKKEKIPERYQNFGSSSIRMTTMESGLGSSPPGPGHFIKDSSTIGRQNTIFPVNNHGSFGTTSERFSVKQSDIEIGPGQYNAPSFTMELQKKAKIGSYGVFGSTSRRFSNIKSNTPGVGVYNPITDDKWMIYKKNDPRSSVFASRTKREGLLNANSLELPSPGDYFSHTSWLKPSITKKEGDFGTKVPRFSSTLPPNGTNDNPNLAPGRYQDFGSFCRTMNKKSFSTKPTVFSTSPRFDKPKVSKKWYDGNEPAPGTYEIPNQWNKKSFNATISDA